MARMNWDRVRREYWIERYGADYIGSSDDLVPRALPKPPRVKAGTATTRPSSTARAGRPAAVQQGTVLVRRPAERLLASPSGLVRCGDCGAMVRADRIAKHQRLRCPVLRTTVVRPQPKPSPSRGK